MPTKRARAVPFVMKKNYVSVVVKGESFSLDNTHPTFADLVDALKHKRWSKVPRLINLARSIMDQSQGNVTLKGGVVLYKGKAIHSSLTNYIMKFVKDKKPVSHLLKFMDNLYKNPQQEAINEFFDWLHSANLPITDDGCFIAYKSVNDNYMDKHTGKIDNSPGQVIQMPRQVADLSWRTACSSGFHVCSKEYGLYGSQVMAVKVNPRDVIAAPSGGKMRVCRYEVLKHLGRGHENLFKEVGIAGIEGETLVEIKKERKALLASILDNPTIKRAIRKKKLSLKTIAKSSYARLSALAKKYEVLAPKKKAEKTEKVTKLIASDGLKQARLAAGLSVGQVAKAMGKNYKEVAKLETKVLPSTTEVDNFLMAIAKAAGVSESRLSDSAISYPKPTVRANA